MQFRADRPSSTDPIGELLTLCRRASDAILGLYNDAEQSGLLREKSDRSPLTAADMASHRILHAGLEALDSQIPLLSEESDAQSLEGRHGWNRFWMVDPLDGTREFLERTGQFTINVALIEDQRPTLGIIYEPMKARAFVGLVGEGAWCMRPEGEDWTSSSLRTRALPESELIVLASHRHRNDRLSQALAYLQARYSLERRNSGSALKFCDLAAGHGDFYPRFSPCSEWDVAAGDALVTAAGGGVWGMDGKPLRYNARDTLLSEHFLAVGDPASPLWNDLLDEFL